MTETPRRAPTERSATQDEPLPSFRLDGRVALVTGAGRGLGAAASVALAAAGAEVIALSRTKADLDALAARVAEVGGRARPIVCDVTDDHQRREAFRAIDRLDILVNNAGINIPEPFTEVPEEHLDRILGLNIRAAFLVAQAAVRKMLAEPVHRTRGGAVINVSSQMGHVGAPRRTVYCMTKHALEGLTKAMTVELAPHNIRVNAIGPTFVETPMTAPFFAEPAFRSWVMARIPLGRIGRLEDVQGAIVFLASPGASLITGASLLIDSGWTAQ